MKIEEIIKLSGLTSALLLKCFGIVELPMFEIDQGLRDAGTTKTNYVLWLNGADIPSPLTENELLSMTEQLQAKFKEYLRVKIDIILDMITFATKEDLNFFFRKLLLPKNVCTLECNVYVCVGAAKKLRSGKFDKKELLRKMPLSQKPFLKKPRFFEKQN